MMTLTALTDDPYGTFPWDGTMSHEYPERWLEELTEHERTMVGLLDYDNPKGLHPNEARWRDLARKLKRGTGKLPCCETGWLPCGDGSFVECHVCGVRET